MPSRLAERFWSKALRAFALDAQSIQPMRGGVTNESVHIATSARGSFVLRRHAGLHVDVAAIERKLEVVAALAKRSTYIAQPACTGDGRYAFCDGAGVFSASRFIEGRCGPEFSSAAACGAMLARYHRAAQHYQRRNVQTLCSQDLLRWLAGQFGDLAKSRRSTRVADWPCFARIADRCAALIEDAGSRCHQMLWVHGDPSPTNIVSRQGIAVGIIDFDFVHFSERVYDIATLVDAVSWEEVDTGPNCGPGEQVLLAYEAESPLHRTERSLIDVFRIRRNLAMMWYIAQRHPVLEGRARRNLRRNGKIVARLFARLKA